jgi:hypothetical protein
MGKSVFGIIFLLFIVNAITVSSLNKPGMDTKYSEFFPNFPLPRESLSTEKKGYVVLYCYRKPFDKYFVVQFDFSDMSWKCVYEGKSPDVYKFSKEFRQYKCFFIFDSMTLIDEINILYFDGVVISISSPESAVTEEEICKYTYIHSAYYYFPLWDDSETEALMHHFKLPNTFDTISRTDDIISTMGLENLKKTDVFGNNPRILASPSQEIIHLSNLIGVLERGDFCRYLKNMSSQSDFDTKCTNEVIHRFFFIKPESNYEGKIIIPVSSYVLNLINRYVDNLKIDEARLLYTNSLLSRNPSFQGMNYETLFHTYISKTGRNCTINIKFEYKFSNKKFKPRVIEKNYIFDVLKYVRESEIIPSKFDDDQFHVPKKFNFPTFDSVFKGTIKSSIRGVGKKALFFFQCTVGNKHDIKEEGYSIIEDCLNLNPDIKEVSFIFIVPNPASSFEPILCPPLQNLNNKI